MRDWSVSVKRAFAEFRRRRIFRAIAVYLVVGWLLIQIADATFAPLGFPAWTMKLLIVLLGLGFVLALSLAWIYDLGPRGLERTAATDSETLPRRRAADSAAVEQPIAAQPAPAPEASVAILPFADMSESKDQDYFCDGLAEEILNALAAVRGLRVASRTSSFRFRDGATDARDIGRALNVAAIMEGSVRKAGERVRVTAQLIDAGNGYHLWSENFDRRLEDIFAIQEEIARNVVQALRLSLKTPEALDFERNAPRDMHAYDFYLRGRQLQAKKATDTWLSAPEMFRRAIQLDPDYAQAHAGLADAIVHLLLWRMARPEDVPLDEALAASRRALALAPDLAEAHVAQANILSLTGDNTAAVAAFESAIALNPRLYEAHYYLARHCFARGLYARARDEFEAAHSARPDEFQALGLAALAANTLGEKAHADAMSRRALQLALEEADADPGNGRARYYAALLQQRLGDVEGGRSNIEAALRLRPDEFGTLYNAACFYAHLGETDRALDLLDRAVATGHGFRDWIEHDSDLESLRSLSRFQDILARLGQPATARAG
ncbi:tetratricopeptide repeat protein [Lysobacter sp. CFH 32150]|uniref:TPR end-of-group domain-containing protein n=1 Tax=Lysobacter sp. CFH 32150 TaxID=2927128 RepID=UPI001FA7243A|nr:tetratricopeptide repeat protein [Lysobacter sp. CFH 32150]MCI4568838.1 tetratricopeptide repeat protein [Lysobacter sp. CFH 32150]